MDTLIKDLIRRNITDSALFARKIFVIDSTNNAILSTRGFETNEREMNKYFLKWLIGGANSLNEDQKDSIAVMATSCPYSNGTAVYKARTMYASINPGMDYDDLVICNSSGVYKNGGHNQYEEGNIFLANMMNNKKDSGGGSLVLTERKMKLYPNPASDNITIEYGLKENEAGLLKVYDILGRERMIVALQSDVNFVLVSIGALESGLYSYKYFINDTQQLTGKLLIER